MSEKNVARLLGTTATMHFPEFLPQSDDRDRERKKEDHTNKNDVKKRVHVLREREKLSEYKECNSGLSWRIVSGTKGGEEATKGEKICPVEPQDSHA